MLDFDSAQTRLAARARAPSTQEIIGLDELRGRVLANDIVGLRDLPPADNSSMDGYALRCADVPGPGTSLPVQQRCFAGETPDPLLPGHATRLFTGSLIPTGADTVVMQEYCEENDNAVTINTRPRSGDNIRRRSEDMREGHNILRRGTRVGAAELAVLAAQGYTRVPVFPLLNIGILSTGDELMAPGQPLKEAAIYNSNSPMLASMCAGMHTAPAILRHAPDNSSAIQKALEELASSCDLILSVGGASVGEKDLVKPVIESMGGKLDMWRVRMKPGKPVALASLLGRTMVCLPGNPVSAFVVFMLLVSPLIRGMQGCRGMLPPTRRGILRLDKPMHGKRDDFLRIQANTVESGLPTLTPHPQQSSGAISSLAWAHGLARVPADIQVASGTELDWYAFSDWLA